MSDHISMPKIIDSNGEMFKVKLDGELLRQFKAYGQAYEQSYGKKINSELLIGQLINFGLSRDQKFKKWYKNSFKDEDKLYM